MKAAAQARRGISSHPPLPDPGLSDNIDLPKTPNPSGKRKRIPSIIFGMDETLRDQSKRRRAEISTDHSAQACLRQFIERSSLPMEETRSNNPEKVKQLTNGEHSPIQ